MGLGKFSLREVFSRPQRAALTVCSITIGVAAVVSVLIATTTARQAQTEMVKAVSGNAQLEVVSDGPSGFEYSVVKQLQEMEGVQAAAPSITRFGVVFVGEAQARTQVLGIDPRVDQQVRAYEVTDGKHPETLLEIMLDSSFAASLNVSVGTEVKILGRGGLKAYTVVGLVRPSGAESVALGSAAYLVLPSAQRAFKVGNVVDKVLISKSDDIETESLQERIAGILPSGVSVRQPRTGSDMARETMFATENGLLMAIAFALLISLFIIYNTFQMAVGERRRQLGILRAIGATRKQVGNLILKEALWMSVIGTILGSCLGVWGAGFLTDATEAIMQVELPRVAVTWTPFVIAAFFGTGVSLLGAYLPARRASMVSPIEAMRSIELKANDAVIRRATPLAFIVIPLGFVLLYITTLQVLPIGGDIVAVVLILLGYVLLIPMLLEPTSGPITKALTALFGIEATLAKKQLMRHVGRSTLTVGVLFIAISTTTGLAGNILDNTGNVRQWYERTFAGDFFIRASMPDLATGAAADMPDGVGEQLARIDGVQQLDSLRFVSTTSQGSDVLLVVGSHAASSSGRVGIDIVDGDYAEAIAALKEGKVIVGSVLAERRKLKVGDKIEIETEQGTQSREIAAFANDYIGGGLTIHFDESVALREMGVSGVDAYAILADKSKLAEVEAANDALNRLDKSVEALWQSLAVAAAPAVRELADEMTKLATSGELQATFKELAELTSSMSFGVRAASGAWRELREEADKVAKVVVLMDDVLRRGIDGTKGLLDRGLAQVDPGSAAGQFGKLVSDVMGMAGGSQKLDPVEFLLGVKPNEAAAKAKERGRMLAGAIQAGAEEIQEEAAQAKGRHPLGILIEKANPILKNAGEAFRKEMEKAQRIHEQMAERQKTLSERTKRIIDNNKTAMDRVWEQFHNMKSVEGRLGKDTKIAELLRLREEILSGATERTIEAPAPVQFAGAAAGGSSQAFSAIAAAVAQAQSVSQEPKTQLIVTKEQLKGINKMTAELQALNAKIPDTAELIVEDLSDGD